MDKTLIEDVGKAGILERVEEIKKSGLLGRLKETIQIITNPKKGGLDAINETINKLEIITVRLGYKDLVSQLGEERKDSHPMLGDDYLPNLVRYNALGTVYPLLNREQRGEVVSGFLRVFDGLRYDYVQFTHTPNIREPLLLADLGTARRLYWPGLRDQKNLWEGKKFSELRKEIIDENGLFDQKKVRSDFLVAYALMRSDIGNFGEEYMQAANPTFLDRVLKGIVALRFAGVENLEIVEKGRKRLQELLPKSTYDTLESLRKEADWIDPKQFP